MGAEPKNLSAVTAKKAWLCVSAMYYIVYTYNESIS